MLKKIFEFAKSKGMFEVKEIRNLDKSCCDVELKVIDFDKFKIKICSPAKQSRKSCDCLKLCGSIDFIEMKSIKNICKHNDSVKAKNVVEKFDLETKITDSLWLFDYLIGYEDLKPKSAIKKTFLQIEKNYFVVGEGEGLERIVFAFNAVALEEEKKIVDTIKIKLNEIKESRINKPKYMTCEDLVKHYRKKGSCQC